jgi:hypothetical protein
MILPFQQATRDLKNRNGAPRPDGSSYANKISGKYAHRIIQGGKPETDRLRWGAGAAGVVEGRRVVTPANYST